MTNHLLHWCQKDFQVVHDTWNCIHLTLAGYHACQAFPSCISCWSLSLIVDRLRLHCDHETLHHVHVLLAAAWCRVCL